MKADSFKTDLEKVIQDCLAVPVADPRFLPLTEKVVKLVRTKLSDSENLRRYRETRKRMDKSSKYSTAAPNFPYTVHST